MANSNYMKKDIIIAMRRASRETNKRGRGGSNHNTTDLSWIPPRLSGEHSCYVL